MNSVDDVLTNQYSATCGAYTACKLMHPGCSTDWTGTAHIRINPSSLTTDFLQAKQGFYAGYEQKVCIQCRNLLGSTVNLDNFEVTQKTDCNTALTPITIADIVLDYDIKKQGANAAYVVDGYTYAFTNAAAIRSTNWCPESACSLYAEDCSSALSSTNIVLTTKELASPWEIRVNQIV